MSKEYHDDEVETTQLYHRMIIMKHKSRCYTIERKGISSEQKDPTGLKYCFILMKSYFRASLGIRIPGSDCLYSGFF